MALYTLKPSVQRIAGSRGGSTFTKTPAGHVIRRRFKPKTIVNLKTTAVRSRFMSLTKRSYSISPSTKLLNDQRAILFPRTNSLGQTYTISGLNELTAQNIGRIQVGGESVTLVANPSPTRDLSIIGGGWSLDPELLAIILQWSPNNGNYNSKIEITPAGSYNSQLVDTPDFRIAGIFPITDPNPINLLPAYYELFGTPRWEVGLQIRIRVTPIARASGQSGTPFIAQLGLAP